MLLSGCVFLDDELASDLPPVTPAGPADSEPAPGSQVATAESPAASAEDKVAQASLLKQKPAESSASGPRPSARAGVSSQSSPRYESADPQISQWLAQAEWASRAGRLTHPPGFNARDYYQLVLQKDPRNAAARQGLENVLDQSIDLSLEAAQRGDYKQAELYLTRAGKFALNHPGIRGTRQYIHQLSRRGLREYTLPADAVRLRDADILAKELELIAENAVENKAYIEILAPDDLQGVWLFDRLRHFAGEEPLRATIHASAQPMIRLVWRR